MAYYDLNSIKLRLGLTTTGKDTEINDIGDGSDAFINTQLSIHEATLPITGDAELTTLSNRSVVAEYLFYNSPDHPRALYDASRKDIIEYIKAKYAKRNPDNTSNKNYGFSSAVSGIES